MIHAFDMEIKNSATVLSELIETIKMKSKSNDVYLLCKREKEMSNEKFRGSSQNSFGIRELALPVFFKKLGIKSLTLCDGYDTSSLAKYEFIILNENISGNLWNDIKNDQLIADLMLLFQKCRSVAFDELPNVARASELLNGLLNDVLKPLKKTDLDFIFYLGAPGRTLFFNADEMLHMINKFTLQGRVTFVLDEHEAINLWMMLNGELPNTTLSVNTATGLKKKCFSIFRTLNIDRLLIYSVNSVIIFSEDQQFIFARRDHDQIVEITSDVRDKFIAGFGFGLLCRLDIQHCIALGMILFGAHIEINNNPDPADLLLYIEKWLADQ
jgi:hypothetical protein